MFMFALKNASLPLKKLSNCYMNAVERGNKERLRTKSVQSRASVLHPCSSVGKRL